MRTHTLHLPLSISHRPKPHLQKMRFWSSWSESGKQMVLRWRRGPARLVTSSSGLPSKSESPHNRNWWKSSTQTLGGHMNSHTRIEVKS